jgi:hypothetical protein
MADRAYWSADRRYGLRLPEAELARMLVLSRKAKRQETGGILVGSYSERLDCAIVRTASRAPRDSRSGGSWFHRGVRGLQRWLNGLWKSKTYYLGEWHFHPFAAPTPSETDVAEMGQMAENPSYHCPEPVLVILGGDPGGDWQLRAFVFLGGRQLVELHEAAKATTV